MFLSGLTIAAGLVLLVVGGDLLVRGASTIGLRMGMRPILVGMTIVGFGTSAPELAASLDAAFRDAPGLVLGTIVGSNIANIGLILGMSALAAPLVVDRAFATREAPLLVLSGLTLALVAWDGSVTRVEAALLLTMLPLVLKLAGHGQGEDSPVDPAPGPSLRRPALLALAGLVALPLGAHWFVGGAVAVAHHFALNERIVGLTMVALGTSLPELFSSLAAARRGLGSMVVGNVIGSNIFNVFGILGLTAVVHPLVTATAVHGDLIAVALASAAAAMLVITGQRLSRAEGLAMLAGYAVIAGIAIF